MGPSAVAMFMPCYVSLFSLRGVFSNCLVHPVQAGSDDRSVSIWNTATQQVIAYLRGHTNNVRALVWHAEIPYVLLSGSWDGCIRMWDVRTGICLATVADHQACRFYDFTFVFIVIFSYFFLYAADLFLSILLL
jgi:WD40 repeat protein